MVDEVISMRKMIAMPLLIAWLLRFATGESYAADVLREHCQQNEPKVVARIYFSPFDILTYSAITKQNVEQTSVYRIWIVCGKEFITPGGKALRAVRELSLLLRATKGREDLDNASIRLKIELPGETFYADQAGRVEEKTTGARFILLKKQMAEIEKHIQAWSGVVDLKASRRIQSSEEPESSLSEEKSNERNGGK
jgi:hypothetical protein